MAVPAKNLDVVTEDDSSEEESGSEDEVESEEEFSGIEDDDDDDEDDEDEDEDDEVEDSVEEVDQDQQDEGNDVNSINTEHTEDTNLANDSSDEDNDSSYNSDNDAESLNVNASWADSIAKILKTNKPKNKKTLVLSKAKKLTDPVKEKLKPAGFQVATADGDVKEEQIVEVKAEQSDEPPRKKKKEVLSLRVKPNILNKDRERQLSKIATKGVVQLFNAVKAQQKDIHNKLVQAGPLEVKRDKVLKNIDKRTFLDVLMGEESQSVETALSNKEEKRKDVKEEGVQSTWNVLRDDFMMGAKMKDWDKELEGEEELEQNIESD